MAPEIPVTNNVVMPYAASERSEDSANEDATAMENEPSQATTIRQTALVGAEVVNGPPLVVEPGVLLRLRSSYGDLTLLLRNPAV